MMLTDGITEACLKDRRNDTSDMYGNEKLQELFADSAHLPAEEIKNTILYTLNDYDCYDDVTFMIIKRTA